MFAGELPFVPSGDLSELYSFQLRASYLLDQDQVREKHRKAQHAPCGPIDGRFHRASLARRPRASGVLSTGPAGFDFRCPKATLGPLSRDVCQEALPLHKFWIRHISCRPCSPRNITDDNPRERPLFSTLVFGHRTIRNKSSWMVFLHVTGVLSGTQFWLGRVPALLP